MNDRIRQLADEAGLLVHNPNGIPTKLAKFSELIVREYSLVADRAQAEDMGWNIGEIIKEHFGVENERTI